MEKWFMFIQQFFYCAALIRVMFSNQIGLICLKQFRQLQRVIEEQEMTMKNCELNGLNFEVN